MISPAQPPELTLPAIKLIATQYSEHLSAKPVQELFGRTDGKAVGTYIEADFNRYIAKDFIHTPGNAATGIDFPDLGVDLKVTSVHQPQSSSPFRDAAQKVYGLGYHLLVFVYEKIDDLMLSAARLTIQHTVFIDCNMTGDYQTTIGIQRILEQQGNVDDIDAFLQERNLPLDEIGSRALAKRIVDDPPAIGCLTISNALQWRLQYGRAITTATEGQSEGVRDLNV